MVFFIYFPIGGHHVPMVFLPAPKGVRQGNGNGGIGVFHHPGLGAPDIFKCGFKQTRRLVLLQHHPERQSQFQPGIQVVLIGEGVTE
jgi:hypothetical protein